MKRFIIPRNSWLYSNVAHMSFYMRYIFTGILLTCIIAVWFFAAYRPIEKKIQNYAQSLQNTHDQIQRMCTSCEQKEQLSAVCAELQSRASLTSDNATDERFLSMLELIRTSGPTINSYTVDQLRTKKAYALYPIHIMLRGIMPQLIASFNALAQLPFPITCTHCMFTRADAGVYTITMDLKSALLCSEGSIKDPSTQNKLKG